MKTKLMLLIAAMSSALATGSPTAHAFQSCKNEATRHCYALTEWHMIDAETVLGSRIQIDTLGYEVPEAGSGETEFLTNEMWDGFDGGKHWIESGQIAAHGYPFRYFWDVFNHQGFSTIYQYEGAETNKWNTYKLQYDNSRLSEHAWDVYINESYMGYGTGLELESNELEAGLETTNANNADGGETAYAENLGVGNGLWWSGWEASGTGNYAKPRTKNASGEGWSGGCAYNLFGEGNKGDIFFGDKPCGDNPLVALPPVIPTARATVTAPLEGGPTLSTTEIAAIATKQSEIEGESQPSNMTVVAAPRAQALALALPGTGVTPTTEVETDVVQMHGHFTASLVPQGREAPTGAVMTLVINAHTGEVIGEHLGNEPLTMGTLGSPQTLVR